MTKTSDARKKANKKYSNSQWRPNIYINPENRYTIEKHYQSLGYDSFNQYVKHLINEDIGINI